MIQCQKAESVVAWCLLVGALACSGGVDDPDGPGPDLCDTASALRSTPQFLTVAEEAHIAARTLPGGFGGLYQDLTTGRLVAYFKDLEPANQRKADLRTLLECGAAYPGWAGTMVRTDEEGILLRQGQYPATELFEFLTSLQSLGSDPAVWGLEVDPETNRVWIGIVAASELGRIQQAVLARSVPLAAVMIEVPPPIAGSEQFEVLNDPAMTLIITGSFEMWLRVRFTNLQGAPRYPDWCTDINPTVAPYMSCIMEKWDGTSWVFVKPTVCVSVLLPPRVVNPGQAVTDSVRVLGSRKLNTHPAFLTARITGTYRLVGRVYRSTVPPGFLTDPAPQEEQVSRPFRIRNTLPF